MKSGLFAALILLAALPATALPRVVVTTDDTVIRESCEIVIPPGTIIPDANTNGVLHIEADDVVVRFTRTSVLRGAPPETPWDQLRGIGIRTTQRRGVRILNARVHGFFNGIVATHTERLLLDGGDFSDNYRQRLRSTPVAEDGSDWLFPHHNDQVRWRDQYGGAICIEDSREPEVRRIRVRRGQNGILLDRVRGARIYDNDCSFLSGWGIALWRSSSNVVSRNAFDFCIRGHVEGVYNRGQDSAGILCFEQSSDNLFIENSATHGGDGFFGFAGREALGEVWLDQERARLRRETGRDDVEALIKVPADVARDFSARGCNRNLLLNNDFSYASAHGIEMTFSEDNVFARNRLVENAICGIWGGYSSGTLIADNEIAGNGGMAYGLERGGINMEHASRNRIVRNLFMDNKCAIHLWWDPDTALLRNPGVAGNYLGVRSNLIAGNRFLFTSQPPFPRSSNSPPLIVLQLRDQGSGNVRDNLYLANEVRLPAEGVVEWQVQAGSEPHTNGTFRSGRLPRATPLGRSRPVGARAHLQGRDNIIMDEWGPWDHESPLLRPLALAGARHVYELRGSVPQPVLELAPGRHTPETEITAAPGGAWQIAIRAGAGTVVPYAGRIRTGGFQRDVAGLLLAADWEVTFFPWSVDPREDLAAWRQLARSTHAVRTTVSALDFPYGMGGPRNVRALESIRATAPGADRFGMIATTRLRLPAGTWRVKTLSDDGVRVSVNGQPVLENWTWHGPTPNEAIFTQASESDATLEVEHFEIDGYAVLRVDLEPVASPE